MTKKATMIVNAIINRNEQESFNEYGQRATAIFKEAGAVPQAKYQINETFLGQGECKLVSIMEFPCIDTLKNTFQSAEYQALLSLRDKAFDKLDIYIAN